MKNILIVRSANFEVIEKLIFNIKNREHHKEYSLFCITQTSFKANLQKKFPEIVLFEMNDEFFKYNSFIKNKELYMRIKKIIFDEVYIPSSSRNFQNFTDVLLIVSRIRAKKVTLYTADGEQYEEKLSFLALFFEKYLGEYIFLFRIIVELIITGILYYLTYPIYIIKNLISTNLKSKLKE